jgi:acetyl esterase/lipase
MRKRFKSSILATATAGVVAVLWLGMTSSAGQAPESWGAVGASSALAERPLGDASAFAASLATNYRVISNITYLTASGVDLKLDFYRPVQSSNPVPTAIFFHGGGYRVTSKKEAWALNVLPYLQMGWNAVNVEYRSSGIALAPAAVEDARCAVRWVVQNAKEYYVDTERIVVTGTSAGAHLALMTGLAPESAGFDRRCPGQQPLKIAAIVSWYGIFDFTTLVDDPAREYAITWIGAEPDRRQVAARVSPNTYIRAGLPPTIAIHGDADQTVPYDQEVDAINALKHVGVVAELVTIPGGRHGNFDREQVLRAWTAIEAFLRKNGLVKLAAESSSSQK